MRYKILLALTALGMATSAHAGVVLTSVPGSSPYTGPAPDYDFDPDGTALVTGGVVTTGSVHAVQAQPYGSTDNYWSVGPSATSPGFWTSAAMLGLTTFPSSGDRLTRTTPLR